MKTHFTLYKVASGDKLLDIIKEADAIESLTILTDHREDWTINVTGKTAFLIHNEKLLYIIN